MYQCSLFVLFVWLFGWIIWLVSFVSFGSFLFFVSLFICTFICLFVWDSLSLCNLCCPGTGPVDQTELKLRDTPAFAYSFEKSIELVVVVNKWLTWEIITWCIWRIRSKRKRRIKRRGKRKMKGNRLKITNMHKIKVLLKIWICLYLILIWKLKSSPTCYSLRNST